MGNLIQPKVDHYRYDQLLLGIENGDIKLPRFQRKFVWSPKASADLLDSIVKGYPIGTFIIWQTKERMAHFRDIGDCKVHETKEGVPTKYVLDGQQRLASIFASINGKKIGAYDYNNIYVDLSIDHINQKDKSDEANQIISSTKPKGMNITVSDLIKKDIAFFNDNYKEKINLIDEYRKRFNNYDFSVIEVHDYSFDQAVDIFNKINTTGTKLSTFDIMSAKTYEIGGFDLSEKYEKLQEDLADSYSIPSSVLLQAISINLIQNCQRRNILRLKKNEIINIYDKTVKSIKKAIDYFKISYTIPVSKILPYESLIIPFQYFFYINNKEPNTQQAKLLQEYFWRASLTHRFSGTSETNLEYDCKKIIYAIYKGVNDKKELFGDLKITLTSTDLENYKFSIGEAVCKSVLCMLHSLRPKYLTDHNKEVLLEELPLAKTNAKSYHHIFPTAYMNTLGKTNSNMLSNILLISASENSRIGPKPPSEYITMFQHENDDLQKSLQSHLIENLDDFGMMTNNYELFLKRRSELIWMELKKRFDPQ